MASDRMDKLRQRAEAARARLAAAEARERTTQRKRRTHAAVVAGALLLDAPGAFGLDAERVRAALDQAVRRPHDRRALGLPVTGDGDLS